jgi:PPOX class probable F420-dependent enzyme
MPTAIHPFEALNHHIRINLTTFRRNGEPVSTPVNFAELDGKVYVVTGATTGKVKRLTHNSRAQIAPCDRRGKLLGAPIEVQARILSKEESDTIRQRAKFTVPAPILFILNWTRTLQYGGIVYLEIRPGSP